MISGSFTLELQDGNGITHYLDIEVEYDPEDREATFEVDYIPAPLGLSEFEVLAFAEELFWKHEIWQELDDDPIYFSDV